MAYTAFQVSMGKSEQCKLLPIFHTIEALLFVIDQHQYQDMTRFRREI
jgi:hypothetical protein